MSLGVPNPSAGVALPLLLALGACGGGGGGGPQPITRPPVTNPTPVPTPSPTPTNFATAEYARSTGVVQANALPAYQAGATGTGIVAGVIDSGVDIDSPEFTGRISAASADLDGNRGLQDEDGHGTAVSAVLLGAKNDRGMHGVAFGATLLVLRTDEPGSCANVGGSEDESGCQHNDSAIARALDLALAQRARVVNISLGGSPANAALRAAISRATAAGMVIVISAGNDSEADPDPLARIASDPLARGQVIIAGSVDTSQNISSFSNRAGADAQTYLTALGTRVPSIDQNGTSWFYNGTSFSAPHIAGAVALLAEAFPNLTGAQIVQLLYASATDLGEPGVDPVYGRGLLNIGAAFQPQGGTALAGSTMAISLTQNGTLSAPMGDAGQGMLGAVVLDGFDRAFAVDLAASIRAAPPSTMLSASLLGEQRSLAATGTDMTIALSIRPGADGVTVDRLLLAGREGERARATAAFVSSRLGRDTSVAIGIAQSGAGLAAQLDDRRAPAFLIARDPGQSPGFEKASDSAVAIRHQLSRTALWASAEQGDALVYERIALGGGEWRYRRYGYGLMAFGADRRFGPVRLGMSASQLVEDRTVLGARFGPVFGVGGARSWFVDLGASVDVGDSWTIGASARRGWTIASSMTLRTDAYSFDIARPGLVDPSDRFGFRVSQPLRVRSGGLDVDLPTSYDYESGVTAYTIQRLDLTPEGREIDVEASYARDLAGGRIGTNLYYRRDPGNYAAFPDDIGAAVQFSRSF